jgi:hypothetical protein
LAGAVALSVWDGRVASTPNEVSTAFSPDSITLQILVIASVAGTGLIGANILRRKDNLIKIVGTSTSLVVIIIAQSLLFPHLLSNTFTMQTTAGVAITSISTWTYNQYKESAKSTPFDMGNEEEGNQVTPRTRVLISKRQKLFWAYAIILTLFISAILPRQHLKSSSFDNHLPSQTSVNDIERFFLPRNIIPTEWTEGANRSPRCGWNYIIQHGLHSGTSEGIDWELTSIQVPPRSSIGNKPISIPTVPSILSQRTD